MGFFEKKYGFFEKVRVFEKSMGFLKKYGFLKKIWAFEKSMGFCEKAPML